MKYMTPLKYNPIHNKVLTGYAPHDEIALDKKLIMVILLSALAVSRLQIQTGTKDRAPIAKARANKRLFMEQLSSLILLCVTFAMSQ